MTDANATRPIREIQWQRKISATRAVTETRYVYADTTQVDALATVGLLDVRETRAAFRLYGLFLAAGLSPRVTPRQDVAPDEAPETIDDMAADMPAEEARTVYRALLRDQGDHRASVLDSLMHGTLPDWRLGVAITALSALADGWGFE